MTTGQSANSTTGLPGVLGVTAGVDVVTFGAPRALLTRLQSECPGVSIESKPLAGVYSSRPSLFIGGFCFLRSELTRALPAFRRLLAGGGTLWVFWPKPGAWDAEGIRPEMGITPEAVSECAAALGLQRSESCELDEVWSGLKLVPRS
jgi:hypothetical protein